MDSEGGGKVYLTFHKSFVREGVPYVDRDTGEERTFNSVTLPSDTVLDGIAVGGFRFSPLFVDRSRFDEDQRVVPLLADREVRLTRVARDAEGNVVLGDDGEPEVEELRAKPQ
ncbi:MAG: DNA gyrase, partial [Eggerthella lenta]